MALKGKKKNYMWYKVNELSGNKLNKSQISKEIGVDRATVRKYLSMSEQEFHQWINNPRHLPHKLTAYMKFVKKELSDYPYLSAAQIEDRLKEHFTDLPDIHSKTVYNFVQIIRKEFHIEKPGKETFRQYEKLVEPPYGKQGQVDFGEYLMLTTDTDRTKVHFFTMVLSRSRYKFVYFQNQPFTSKTAVYAHELAFAFFEGIPQEILYDQDKVFIHDENLGDYLLTHDFKAFCQGQTFKTVFCRKADPQSKGKIESVVKYVKYNFLKGRLYGGIENLNQSVQEWLKRTGNAKQHGTTHKIPQEEWLIEKTHLSALKMQATVPDTLIHKYTVRKDNTVAYCSNFYTLPLGTYQGLDTKINMIIIDGRLDFYNDEKVLVASHQISLNKGELVRNSNHGRDKSATIEQTHNEVLQMLGKKEKAVLYLDLLRIDKQRYYHDNLRAIKKGITGVSIEIIDKTVETCMENKVYNGAAFSEVAKKYLLNQQQKQSVAPIGLCNKRLNTNWKTSIVVPQISDINIYEKLF